MHEGPTLTVDLAALRSNVAVLRSCLAGPVALMAAVKADGYGHGAEPIARELERAGVEAFGVATAAEALTLRRAGVKGRVLVFGPVRQRIAELVEAGVELTVTDLDALAVIEAAGAPARVHVKLDTGMGRLGLPAAAAVTLAGAVERSRYAELAAVWTHLACADEPDASDPDGLTAAQLQRFEAALGALATTGIEVPLAHAANSAATLRLPRAHYGLVRPGLALYGHHATPAAAALTGAAGAALRPIATLEAPVTFVKRVSRGTSISYGATWRAPRDTVIATVRIGYADGYPRAAGNLGHAHVQGVTVPVVGRVCMDQLMLDVGALAEHAAGVSLTPGERVTLLGPAGPSAAALAASLGTVAYELLTHMSAPRIERSYLNASS